MAWSDIGDAVVGAIAPASWGDAVRANFLAIGPDTLYKLADESVTSSTAFQDDNHLLFAIAANEKWHLSVTMKYTSTGGALKAAINTPTGATGWFTGMTIVSGVVSFTSGLISGGSDITWADATADDLFVAGELYVVNGGTAGSATIRWAQHASSGTATVAKAGSFMRRHLLV